MELLTVIAMISIMVGIAFPSLHKLINDAKVKSVAFDIMTALRSARSQAISTGSIVTVTVSPGNHKLTVGATNISLSDKINFEAKRDSDDKIEYEGVDIPIDFYPSGACESTLYIKVYNPNDLNDTKIVKIVKIESRISGLSRI